jgi:ADP-heptose:LPS heptosyltransferase
MVEFSKNVLPEGTSVRGYTEAAKKYDSTRTGISTKWVGNHTPMRTNAVKYSFHALADYSPKIEECNYLKFKPELVDLTEFTLPDQYFVMQGAYIERVKTMPVNTFNNIKDYFLNKGIDVVVLGKTENKLGAKDLKITANIGSYDFSGTTNLLDKTSLTESTAIIAKSKGLIAIDGGLIHAAGFTNAPIFAGYTFASPEQLMPIRNNVSGFNVFPIVPDESLACRFCQSSWTLKFGHDYRKCFYDDYKCVSQMTAEKFIEQLEKVL